MYEQVPPVYFGGDLRGHSRVEQSAIYRAAVRPASGWNHEIQPVQITKLHCLVRGQAENTRSTNSSENIARPHKRLQR